jgi:hypothetical protein
MERLKISLINNSGNFKLLPDVIPVFVPMRHDTWKSQSFHCEKLIDRYYAESLVGKICLIISKQGFEKILKVCDLSLTEKESWILRGYPKVETSEKSYFLSRKISIKIVDIKDIEEIKEKT